MRNRPRPDNCGFTLLELLVVIAILGLLICLVAPAVLRQLGSARTSIARQSIERIGSILDMYKLDTGTYPSTDQGLRSLDARKCATTTHFHLLAVWPSVTEQRHQIAKVGPFTERVGTTCHWVRVIVAAPVGNQSQSPLRLDASARPQQKRVTSVGRRYCAIYAYPQSQCLARRDVLRMLVLLYLDDPGTLMLWRKG